jgi:hypothetical protein
MRCRGGAVLASVKPYCMRRWARLNGFWLLVLACANGTAKDVPNAELPEQSQNPQKSPVRGFVNAPTVAFRGDNGGDPPATSIAGNACVFGIPYEISVDEARALGFDVDADYAFLEKESVADVLVSGDAVSATKVHVLGQVDHILRADRTPPAGVAMNEAVPSGCPPMIRYELTAQIYTDDGAISGIFAAQSPATTLGSVIGVNVYAQSDLRNFGGSLPVARDTSRPFFGMAEVQYFPGLDSRLAFNFQPRVLYQDSGGFCVEPLCPSVGSEQLARLSFGVVAASEMLPFTDFVSSVVDPTVTSLSEFVGAMGPYHPDVRLWVVASSAEASSVQVRARIDGEEVQTAPLALTHDPRILTADAVGGWIDLGELDESTSVEFDVENPAGLSNVNAHIVIGGCVVTEARNRCAEPGCIAHSAASVSPPACAVR